MGTISRAHAEPDISPQGALKKMGVRVPASMSLSNLEGPVLEAA